MRGNTQLYHQPQTAKRYSVIEIGSIVEANTIGSYSVADRRRMREILKNNIEAQRFYLSTAHPTVKPGHASIIKKLESYRKKIKDNRI